MFYTGLVQSAAWCTLHSWIAARISTEQLKATPVTPEKYVMALISEVFNTRYNGISTIILTAY